MSNADKIARYSGFSPGSHPSRLAYITPSGEKKYYATSEETGFSEPKPGEAYIEVETKSGKIAKVPESGWTSNMRKTFEESGGKYVVFGGGSSAGYTGSSSQQKTGSSSQQKTGGFPDIMSQMKTDSNISLPEQRDRFGQYTMEVPGSFSTISSTAFSQPLQPSGEVRDTRRFSQVKTEKIQVPSSLFSQPWYPDTEPSPTSEWREATSKEDIALAVDIAGKIGPMQTSTGSIWVRDTVGGKEARIITKEEADYIKGKGITPSHYLAEQMLQDLRMEEIRKEIKGDNLFMAAGRQVFTTYSPFGLEYDASQIASVFGLGGPTPEDVKVKATYAARYGEYADKPLEWVGGTFTSSTPGVFATSLGLGAGAGGAIGLLGQVAEGTGTATKVASVLKTGLELAFVGGTAAFVVDTGVGIKESLESGDYQGAIAEGLAAGAGTAGALFGFQSGSKFVKGMVKFKPTDVNIEAAGFEKISERAGDSARRSQFTNLRITSNKKVVDAQAVSTIVDVGDESFSISYLMNRGDMNKGVFSIGRAKTIGKGENVIIQTPEFFGGRSVKFNEPINFAQTAKVVEMNTGAKVKLANFLEKFTPEEQKLFKTQKQSYFDALQDATKDGYYTVKETDLSKGAWKAGYGSRADTEPLLGLEESSTKRIALEKSLPDVPGFKSWMDFPTKEAVLKHESLHGLAPWASEEQVLMWEKTLPSKITVTKMEMPKPGALEKTINKLKYKTDDVVGLGMAEGNGGASGKDYTIGISKFATKSGVKGSVSSITETIKEVPKLGDMYGVENIRFGGAKTDTMVKTKPAGMEVSSDVAALGFKVAAKTTNIVPPTKVAKISSVASSAEIIKETRMGNMFVLNQEPISNKVDTSARSVVGISDTEMDSFLIDGRTAGLMSSFSTMEQTRRQVKIQPSFIQQTRRQSILQEDMSQADQERRKQSTLMGEQLSQRSRRTTMQQTRQQTRTQTRQLMAQFHPGYVPFPPSTTFPIIIVPPPPETYKGRPGLFSMKVPARRMPARRTRGRYIVFPRADYISLTAEEMRTGRKAFHPAPRPVTRRAYERELSMPSWPALRFPTEGELMAGRERKMSFGITKPRIEKKSRKFSFI